MCCVGQSREGPKGQVHTDQQLPRGRDGGGLLSGLQVMGGLLLVGGQKAGSESCIKRGQRGREQNEMCAANRGPTGARSRVSKCCRAK